MNVFALKDVTYRFPEVTALDRVTLEITQGERVAVLGANGSGKSTLLRVLAGLCFPESGSVHFCGSPFNEEKLMEESFSQNFHRRVGVVFQNTDVQLFNPTVFDEIAFGPLQLGWPKTELMERVHVAMEEMEIVHLKDRAPHRLSGGEKKRVALASVLVLDPDVLLMDEPAASLDPKSQGHIVDFLFGCAGKKTVITTTHSLDIIEDIADRCIVLENGCITGDASPMTVLKDTALLEKAHLIHAHRHRHASGAVHSHPHAHFPHGHAHPAESGSGVPPLV